MDTRSKSEASTRMESPNASPTEKADGGLSALSLPGGTVIWLFVSLELLTFFCFFVAFSVGYARDVETFSTSQRQLSALSGTINTIVLLVGSWMVARGGASPKTGPRWWGWMIAASLSGLLFTGIKLSEYQHIFEAGIGLSTNAFWFYYLFLTAFHLAHVLAGVGFTAFVGWHQRPASSVQIEPETAEATAMYWHLVDLIWIMLFPLLYLVGA